MQEICFPGSINIFTKENRMSCKVIAEIGWNFMGDMAIAEKMIVSAKSSGADVAKFQYWDPSKLKPGPWDHDGRLEIYKAAALNEEKIRLLMRLCDENNIEFLISAFNASDASFISSLGIKKLKIPSHEVANTALHSFAANNFEEVYVSLGAGTSSEVEQACEVYNSVEGLFWVGMHCVSSYPCGPEHANLPRLRYLSNLCKNLGYSDHTSDVVTPSISLAFGSRVVEKHFTIDKELPGRDNKFALDPDEFFQMVENIRNAEKSCFYHGPEPRDIEKDTMTNYRGRWGD
jgi:N,N'-diacetyllegionaminate synthase